MSTSGWHSDHSNIVRSNDVLYEMARLFGGSAAIIEPLNELSPMCQSRRYHELIGLRPAGFYGDDVLQVIKQVSIVAS